MTPQTRKKIEAVLRNWAYQPALELYREALGENPPLWKVLAMGDTPYNRGKLAERLRLLLDAPADAPAPASAPKAAAEPLQLQQLERAWRQKYKEAAYLHTQLLGCTDAQRSEYANRIAEAFDFIEDAYAQIDYFHAHGTLPYKAPSSFTPAHYPVGALQRRYENNRKYIYKFQHQLEKAAEVTIRKEENAAITLYLNSL